MTKLIRYKFYHLLKENGVSLLPQEEDQGMSLPSRGPDSWRLLDDENELDALYNGINQRYVSRKVVPFARRDDNDDVACFVVHDELREPGTILVIHDYASPGWEIVAGHAEYPTLNEWITAISS